MINCIQYYTFIIYTTCISDDFLIQFFFSLSVALVCLFLCKVSILFKSLNYFVIKRCTSKQKCKSFINFICISILWLIHLFRSQYLIFCILSYMYNRCGHYVQHCGYYVCTLIIFFICVNCIINLMFYLAMYISKDYLPVVNGDIILFILLHTRMYIVHIIYLFVF